MTQTDTPALEILKPGKQWVCFNGEKEPISPVTLKGVSGELVEGNTDWTWYDAAVSIQRANSDRLKGIGREFIKRQGITGIDLDKCIIDSQIESWAQAIIDRFNSYTELSPSGRGAHIWVYGSIPDNIGSDPDGISKIEMYDHKRYFTWTGKHIEGTPLTIEHRQDEVTSLHTEIRQARQKAKQSKRTTRKQPEPKPGPDSPYGLKALQDEYMNVAQAQEGGRNDQLNRSAYALGQLVGGGVLSRSRVEHELYNAAQRSGLPDNEIEKTMRSGLDKGEMEPRIPPAKEMPRYHALPGSSENGTYTHQNIEPRQVPLTRILEYLGQNEWGDALLFAESFEGQILYDCSEKVWYFFNGQHWEQDYIGTVRHLISGYLGAVYIKASADLNIEVAEIISQIEGAVGESLASSKADDLKDKRTQKESLMKALNDRAKALRSAKRCNNVLSTYAEHDTRLVVRGDKWDRDPWLLAVTNGVVDLRTGTCRDGQPEDYIRTVAPTRWEGLDKDCPLFKQSLNEILQMKQLPDSTFKERTPEELTELIGFLQRLLGYAATGLTIEHIFPILYGEAGRNGKDMLLGILKSVLGAMAGAIHNDVFVAADKFRTAGAATPHLVDLQGKRVVWGSETKPGDKLNVAQIKHVTGGGDIPARQIYGKSYSFKPTHTLFLMTNYKPHAEANDMAFWERAYLIEFCVRFVEDPSAPNERKKNKLLAEKILKSEASGILTWLVQGCLAWQQQELKPPTSVKLATERYRQSEDLVQTFINECCYVLDEKAEIKSTDLYAAYKTWCKDGNLYLLSSTLFGTEIGKKHRKVPKRDGRYYQSIRLRSLTDDPDDPDKPVTDSRSKNEPVTGSESNLSQAAETSSQADGDTVNRNGGDRFNGVFQKVPSRGQENGVYREIPEKNLQTCHNPWGDTTMEAPVKQHESIVTGSESKPVTGIKPDFPCRFCHKQHWAWSTEETDYICLECYSPAHREVSL